MVVLFPGWRGRGLGLTRSLYGTFPVFRSEFDAVCGVLPGQLRVLLVAAVFAPEGGVDAALLTGPRLGPVALFAHQVALYRLWQDWGVAGRAVAGVGEGTWAATHVTGLLGLEEAAGLAAGRTAAGPVATGVRAAPSRDTDAVSGGSGARGVSGRCLLLAGSPEGRAGVGDVPGLLAAFGALQCGGPPVDWEAVWRRVRVRPPVPDGARCAG